MDKKCKEFMEMNKVFRQIKKGISFTKGDTLDYPAHIHEDIELVFVKKGGGNAYCEGKKYMLEENAFFLVFPNQVHHYSESEKGEYIILILKSRDLLTKFHIVKATVFPVVRYGCETWTINKAECRRINAF